MRKHCPKRTYQFTCVQNKRIMSVAINRHKEKGTKIIGHNEWLELDPMHPFMTTVCKSLKKTWPALLMKYSINESPNKIQYGPLFQYLLSIVWHPRPPNSWIVEVPNDKIINIPHNAFHGCRYVTLMHAKLFFCWHHKNHISLEGSFQALSSHN